MRMCTGLIWRALANTVMNVGLHKKWGEIRLSSWLLTGQDVQRSAMALCSQLPDRMVAVRNTDLPLNKCP
jgi:hypothetical protein